MNNTQEKKQFVIFSESETSRQDEPMYWNNEECWTTLDLATRFNEFEHSIFGLPTTGEWKTIEQAQLRDRKGKQCA